MVPMDATTTAATPAAQPSDDQQLADLQQRLLAWYRAHRRDLPWRRTRDPYRVLISEVMLQQTQVERVIPKYHEFLERFPTIEALAAAPTAEVIRVWSGLGYNRRAVNLQRAAQAVVERHGGVMPRDVDELQALPGIGRYTAGAVACFAYEQDVGFVDTNIRRVLHRLFYGPEVPTPRATAREIQALADRVVPAGEGYDWNQGLGVRRGPLHRAQAALRLLPPPGALSRLPGDPDGPGRGARDHPPGGAVHRVVALLPRPGHRGAAGAAAG